MSDTGVCSFVSWVRRGIANALTEPDTLGAAADPAGVVHRAGLSVKLTVCDTAVDGRENESAIQKNIELTGPGDVQGISLHAMMRCEPFDGCTGFNANHLAFIEFYDADLPWRYTPAAPGAGDPTGSRLRPWIALIALTPDEFTSHPAASGPAWITIHQTCINRVLPPHDENWAFAHAQLDHQPDKAGDTSPLEAARAIAAQPACAVSRLLCARRLRPDTTYHCFVIPAFETGRLAGLGEDPSSVAAQKPSWTSGAMPHSVVRPLDFPVYRQWSFTTGSDSDFTTLAQRLAPLASDIRLPGRCMDIAATGSDDETAGTHLVPLPAALRGISDTSDYDCTGSGLRAENGAGTVGTSGIALPDKDLQIRPPVYGDVWCPLKTTATSPNGPAWRTQLNADIVYRACAGLGVAVVHANRDLWVRRAREQGGRIEEVNSRIAQAQLAALTNDALLRKHLCPLSAGRLVMMSSAVHHVVHEPGDPLTLAGRLRRSGIPAVLTGGAFRRLLRPGGPAARSLSCTPHTDLCTSILGRVHKEQAPGPVADQGVAAASPDLDAAASAILKTLQPWPQIVRRLGTQLTGVPAENLNALRPVRLTPSFPEPLYEALCALSADHILPGYADLPHDSVTLMQCNQPFIEAFMAGINHALAGELAWQGFPVEPGAGFFHHFWDSRDALDGPQPDILPLHTWQGPLGSHHPHGGDPTVLVMRGALFEHFPGTVVYARRAAFCRDEQGNEQYDAPRLLADGPDDEVIRFPLFQATLQSDIALFGFSLTPAQLRGCRHAVNGQRPDPGWFIVMQERPGQAHFGFTEAASSAGAGEQIHFVRLCDENSHSRPVQASADLSVRWSEISAAGLASLLMRDPAAHARHAGELLA